MLPTVTRNLRDRIYAIARVVGFAAVCVLAPPAEGLKQPSVATK